jgi:molecular chaperone DnaK (HSP70)
MENENINNVTENLTDDLIVEYFSNSKPSIVSGLDKKDNNDYDNEESENSDDDDKKENNKEDIKKIETIVGIDLGTTNSCVAVWRNNDIEIIPDEFGNRTVPSYVALTSKTHQYYVGQEAKNQKELNPKNVFYEVKRLIGRKRDDLSVINDTEFLTYDLTEDENKNVQILSESNDGKKFTPEEISAKILMKLKKMASEYLNEDITKAVITVPAYFNDAQRQATKDAAEIAGLECIRIINEPTSAALAYGLLNLSLRRKLIRNKKANSENNNGKTTDDDKTTDDKTTDDKTADDGETTIVVYDLGGGTLDVSVLTISDGVFYVNASVGNTHLGGADFDNRLVAHCLNSFKKKNKIQKITDLSLLSLQKLRKSCENAKILLSTILKTYIIVKDFHDGHDLYVPITREEYIKLCRDLLIMCLKPLEDALKSCGMQKDDIDEVILVGGMTRMPVIRDNIRTYFGGKEPNCSVDPDIVVATGAAIQGYILSHQEDPFADSVTLLDIIPLSLGVETIGGVMSIVIPRNTGIPVSKKKKYSTDSDYVTSVNIKIYEGERKMTKDNFFVGEFELSGLESAPRGVAEIEVKFSVDMNGIIKITAEDLDTHNKSGITITGNKGRLTSEQISKLLREAKDFELKDKVERQKKQHYYEIDDLCSNISYNLANENFKLNENDKKIVGDDVAVIKGWMKEKKYYERETDEMKKLIERIKKRYGTLILKVNSENDKNVKATSVNDSGQTTTVFGNDDEEEEAKQIFEKIENEELGIDSENDTEKEEIKQLRNSLMELCDSVSDIISSQKLAIVEDDLKAFRDFLNDTFLWIHIQIKPKKTDFKIKIDEVNEECNKLLEKYAKDEKDIFELNAIQKAIHTKRDELEQLCYALKSCIECNSFSIKEDYMKSLSARIDIILNWLIEIDVEKYQNKNCEDNDSNDDKNEAEYQIKIDELNEMCNKLYQSMVGVNINIKTNIFGNDRDDAILFNEDNIGTSIASLRKMQEVQENVEEDVPEVSTYDVPEISTYGIPDVVLILNKKNKVRKNKRSKRSYQNYKKNLKRKNRRKNK